MSADRVVCGESDVHICVFENFCDESGFFADICELCPLLFLGLCAAVLFFLLLFSC